MNLFRRFLLWLFTSKAPDVPPGDFSSENADLIEQADQFRPKVGLWESEAAEAIAMKNHERALEASDLAASWQRVIELEKKFYGRWQLRE